MSDRQADHRTIDGSVAVVTGGASGIGLGIATRLREAGATVVIADNDADSASAAASAIGATAKVVDVSDFDSVRDLAGWATSEFGDIDILINNAGVGPAGTFEEFPLADFRWVLDINLWGVIHGLKAFLPVLRQNPHGGTIVNTVSVGAFLPGMGLIAYKTSKAAIVAMTQSLVLELGADSPIDVALLVPWLVNTSIQENADRKPSGPVGGIRPRDVIAPGRVIDPLDVGSMVVDGIRRGDRYILTHPESLPRIRAQYTEVLAALELGVQLSG